MTDLEEAYWEAWNRIGPKLLADPQELAARLGRRRSKVYQRPMRAECLAVRASDNRINAATAAMVPDDGAYPGRQDLWRRHDVYLDARLLRQVCVPVSIEPPGELVEDVAKRLGCDPNGLRPLRRNGTLKVHYIKGLAGRHGRPGRPVPLVFTWDPLDPSARGKHRPDPIWGALWTVRAGGLPDDFEQAVARVPVWWRKWGRDLAAGWRWICPRCGRRVRTVYYPTKPPGWVEHLVRRGAVTVEQALRLGVSQEFLDGRRATPPGPKPQDVADFAADSTKRPQFACKRCHGVMDFTRAALAAGWNKLVLHGSGGLLYGHEVKRPVWLTASRRNAPPKQARARSAPRREELTRLLVGTRLRHREIAEQMGLTLPDVAVRASRIYARHGVHCREELRRAPVDLVAGAVGRMAG